ncbi:MAG: (2Fe-2S)-binding protein [Ignavibacteriales bacterium]|nr:MAG: (2Fe-2S)-binding protein [Ignavibacteriales bacterium]
MSSSINFILNNEVVKTTVNPATVVLDFLRKNKKLTGTKEGCREGDCGACAILLGHFADGKMRYKTVNSCLLPILSVNGMHIVTIEGLNSDKLNPIQQAIVDEGATQCGFCTPGFIISLTGYFLSAENVDTETAIEFLSGNICRCTGYASIKRAVEKLVAEVKPYTLLNSLTKGQLISVGIIPKYFSGIPSMLEKLESGMLMERIYSDSEFLIGGGTDLFVQKPTALLSSNLTLTGRDRILSEIKAENDFLNIGAAVSISEIQHSETIKKYFPQLEKLLNLFGSTPIRNRATIGGNIINASPIGDMINILLALNASLHFNDERTVDLKNFFLGYKMLNKKDDEELLYISIPLPVKNYKFNFEKVSRRTYLDIASVNSSIYVETNENKIENIRLSAGGVAPVPFYLENTCNFLQSKEINFSLIDEAASIAISEISPISDARGSADYKKILLRQLILAHFIKLFPALIDAEEVI